MNRLLGFETSLLPYRGFGDKPDSDTRLEFASAFPVDTCAEAGAGLFRDDDVPFRASGNGVGVFSATPVLRLNSAATRQSGSVRMGRAEHCRAQEWRRPRDDHADDDEHEHHGRLAERPFPGGTPPTALTSTEHLRPPAIPTRRNSPCRMTFSDELETPAARSKKSRTFTNSTAHGPADTLPHTYTFDRARLIGARHTRPSPVISATVGMSDGYKVEHYPSTIALKAEWTNRGFGRMPF